MVGLEGSGLWPDAPLELRKTKAAFAVQLAQARAREAARFPLALSGEHPSSLSPSFVSPLTHARTHARTHMCAPLLSSR